MPLTAFPQGLSSFGFPLLGSGDLRSLGNVWFVDSAIGGNAPGYGTDKSRPFASIAYALTRATANNDDVIIVSDGHAESITGAAGWTAVSGVHIVGMGFGAKRPTITFTTSTAAQIVVSGNNVVFENLVFDLTGVDAVVIGIAVTGTDFIMKNCRVVVAGATNQAAIAVDVQGARPSFINCDFYGTSDAGPAAAINVGAATNGLSVVGGRITGNYSSGPIAATSTFHATDMYIDRVTIIQYNGTAKAVIVMTTSSTGMVRDCAFGGHTWGSAADAITNGSNAAMFFVNNYGFDNAGGEVSGVLVPAAGTIS